MNQIWAPWRKEYVTVKKKINGCIFCRALRAPSNKDSKNLLVYRSLHGFLMLNLYPYNNGHLLLMPNRHVSTLEKLKDQERLGLFHMIDRTVQILQKAFHPQGFNIGMNIGRVGGAGIPGHVHIHIVPRWEGDTNFMPVITGTKVISDSLQGVYKTLHRHFRK